MLATFVIGLREGLEASLIVGIIAAFLGQQQRRDALRQVWLGVGAAVLLCLAIGIVLQVVSQNLPHRAQEGLETVVGALAVGMVTYMIVWMSQHARGLKGELEGAAAQALHRGSTRALIVMAFLAVLREGFETAVFLLATFQASDSALLAATGAALGIVLATVVGYGIYRGGVRLNLSRFFRVTGVVLVLVAAGLVMSALHSAHEAGWVGVGQQQAVDLSWLVLPDTPLYALFGGVLGIQPNPTVIEATGWLFYAVPMALFVVWPRNARRKATAPATAEAAG
jgi:high-affinity iron transporter